MPHRHRQGLSLRQGRHHFAVIHSFPITTRTLAARTPWLHNGSMDITVKRIPDELYQNFRKLSSQNGRSLNSEIIAAMDAAVAGLESSRN